MRERMRPIVSTRNCRTRFPDRRPNQSNYTHTPEIYDEVEGIFPDGQYTLVECDRQNNGGPSHIDIWKLKLDARGEYERLTFFGEYAGYKSSNPVVSDDGKFFAFQMGVSRSATGSIGRGIMVYDLEKARQAK